MAHRLPPLRHREEALQIPGYCTIVVIDESQEELNRYHNHLPSEGRSSFFLFSSVKGEMGRLNPGVAMAAPMLLLLCCCWLGVARASGVLGLSCAGLDVGTVSGGGVELFSFEMAQSLEASPGRIVLTREAREHPSATPFATLRGGVSLRAVCPVLDAHHGGDSNDGGGLLLEARLSRLAVDCDESRTPDQSSAECATRWARLGDNEGAMALPFWFLRNASGFVQPAETLFLPSEPDFRSVRKRQGVGRRW